MNEMKRDSVTLKSLLRAYSQSAKSSKVVPMSLSRCS